MTMTKQVPYDVLWSSFKKKIETKYSIIDHFELRSCDELDDMFTMLNRCYKPCYEPQEKIVVAHFDTDFYIHGRVGVKLYNFLEIVRQLDIPLSTIVFLTNHVGMEQEIRNHVAKTYHNHDFDNDFINVVVCNYNTLQCPETVPQVEIDRGAEFELIEKHYICLNGKKRTHRVFFLSLLKEMNLLDSGILSWHFNRSWQESCKTEALIDLSVHYKTINGSLLRVQPQSLINDFFLADTELKDNFNRHARTFDTDHRDVRLNEGPDSLPKEYKYWIPAVKQAFLYVTVETVFDYPYPFMSEKTWTPILNRRPFVVIGAVGTLARLHELGFKTFNEFWDESYDSETDCSERMKKVAKICQQICSMSVDELKQMCNNISNTVEYNFEYYIEKYSKSQLAPILDKV